MTKPRITITALLLLLVVVTSGCALFSRQDVPQGLVTFLFDDGAKDVHENAFPIMGDLPGVVYMITGYVNGTTYMSLDQLKELHDAGWEIAAHSVTHPMLTDVSDADLLWELETSRDWIRDNGFQRGMDHFAVPGGAWGDREAKVAATLYDTVRPTSSGYNVVPYDRMNLRSKVITLDTPPQTIIDWINQAINEGTWLMLMFHQVDESSYIYTYHPDDFAQVVAHAKKSLPVVTLTEAFDLE